MKNRFNSYNLQLYMLILNTLIGGVIILYFWNFHKDYSQRIALFVMILAIIYVSIELIKKNFHHVQSKWNRLYYIGLLGVISPIALENKVDLETIKIINQLAILFLVIPLFIEGKLLMNSKKS